MENNLVVGVYVRARIDRDWYVGTVTKLDGEFVVISHRLKSGEKINYRVHEDDVQIIPRHV